VDRLIDDALDIVAAVGDGDRRFHLVGHDWGASLAWQIADQHPGRLASLTILSRPHPLAFARALEMPDGERRRRSRHYAGMHGHDYRHEGLVAAKERTLDVARHHRLEGLLIDPFRVL
jgi:pimeloyl-ACP methyl ester carboxylesterase